MEVGDRLIGGRDCKGFLETDKTRGVGDGLGGISLASGLEFARDGEFFDGSEDGVLITTDEGGVMDANEAALRLLGRSEGELAAAGRNDIFWDSRLKEAIEKRRREGSFRGRLRLARGDGTTFEAEVVSMELEDKNVAIVFREVGRNGDSLGEGFFKALVESRAGVVVLAGEDGVIRYASPSTKPILGREPERLVGEHLSAHLHEEDYERTVDVLGSKASRVSGAFRLRRWDEGWVEVEGSIEKLDGEAGIRGVALAGKEVPSGVGVEDKLRGVSERLAESERRLVESEKLFRTTFDQAPVGLAHVGVDGRWLRVNQKLCDILGRDRRELLGRTFHEFTHTDDLGTDVEKMETMLSGGSDAESVEKRFVKKDFTSVWASVHGKLVHDEDGKPRYFICTIEDITDDKEARRVSRSLTGREKEILTLLAHGMTNRQIAAEMNFSLSSAKVHVGRVIQKLGATDRTNAAVLAARLGIL